jgi:hypothetical protein
MGLNIEDPSTGLGAEVIEKRLRTLADSRTREHARSLEGESYFLSTAQGVGANNTLTTTVTGGAMLVVQNDSPINMTLERFLVGTDTAGTVLRFVRNYDISTLAATDVATPVNLNTGTNKAASVTALVWDETGDGITGLTGGSVWNTFILGVGTTALPPNGGFIVAP